MIVRPALLPLVACAIALTGCSTSERSPERSPERSTERSSVPVESIVTTTLPAPPEGAAYEPTLAIDPANPDHILVAAMRGMPPVRPSTGIWTWQSTDGARTWSSEALDAPRFPGTSGIQAFGADAVVDFAADGATLVASIAGVGARMGTFVSRLPAPGGEPGAVLAFENFKDPRNGSDIFFDKPWMAADRLDGSPYRGSVYVSAGAIVLGATPKTLGSTLPSVPPTSVRLAISRDTGRTFLPLTLVADSAFAAQLAVTPGEGALDVTYDRLVTPTGSARSVYHRRSTDGGATFGPELVVATVGGDTLLDLPVLAARPNGDLLSCWSQGVRSVAGSNQVRCAVRPAKGEWTSARMVDSNRALTSAEAWPAIVGTERGWYLLQYVVDSSRTEVVLYASTDGAAFSRVAVLATIDGVGTDRFCLNSVADCRRTPGGTAFVPGDYVTLAASGGRMAAAYVLPRRAEVVGDSAMVHVSVMEEPRVR